jgi:hypothetical protein
LLPPYLGLNDDLLQLARLVKSYVHSAGN